MLSMTGSLKTTKVRLLMTNLADKLSQSLSQIQVQRASSQGVLTRVVGLTLEATGVNAPVGSYCDIISPSGSTLVAEVVGFGDGKLLLMPFGSVQGIAAGFKVKPQSQTQSTAMSRSMLGRVLDGMGQPLDGGPDIVAEEHRSILGQSINPLKRRPIDQALDVGVRSINALITVGCGQRLGLMAGSGVGKSVLMGMMTRFTKAEVIVIGLIGERGREVQEFVLDSLGDEGLARSVVVAAPGDTSPVTRLHAARLATTIAEFFRDQGKSVLLLMDSISRVAQAQREIGLAIGEPPTTKGYPPSVFTLIPNLMERAGNGHEDGQGAITAFYTVLAEGDDQQDPVVDAARSVLDGHIVLSRELAGAGHYPAIDINQSISRLAPTLQGLGQKQAGQQLRQWLNSYAENKDLITVGAYQAGKNMVLDQALDKKLNMDRFLQQGMHDSCDMATSLDHLQILAQPPQHEFQQSETLQAMP